MGALPTPVRRVHEKRRGKAVAKDRVRDDADFHCP